MQHAELLNRRMVQLRRAERRIDDTLWRVVQALNEDAAARAWDQLDTLVSEFTALRLSNVCRYPEASWQLISRLDLERGPLPGFQEAIDSLCERCLSPVAIAALRSRLYTTAARATDKCPQLLPTIALATLSLDDPDPACNAFIRMVLCASVIEWVVSSGLSDGGPVSFDASTWLAAQPSRTLLAAVGERRAYYYAAIPGVLLLLDPDSVLFDSERLAGRVPDVGRTAGPGHLLGWPSTGESIGSQTGGRYDESVLSWLVDQQYEAALRAEMQRVQRDLRQQYPTDHVADVDMLVCRALEALDDLPPDHNPLLQAIFVQSWVRYLSDLC
jgi:hypothetical protein